MKTVIWIGWLVLAPWLAGQNITGSISGTVTDPSGLPIEGAGVTLTRTSTGAQREMTTDVRGDFVFSAVTPGEYTVTVKQTGFKTAERASVMLTAAEIRSLGQVVLELGDVSQKMTVTAEGTAVQVVSAERAGVVTAQQVENIPNLELQHRRAADVGPCRSAHGSDGTGARGRFLAIARPEQRRHPGD